jgi:hypothetical protein
MPGAEIRRATDAKVVCPSFSYESESLRDSGDVSESLWLYNGRWRLVGDTRLQRSSYFSGESG